MTSPTDSNTQTIQVPDRYAKLGVRRGFLPRSADQLRMVIKSLYGSGKSTFIASDPKTLVLDFDMAVENVFGNLCGYAPLPTWEDFDKAVTLLLADKAAGRCPYSRICFDTVDSYLDLIDRRMVEERRALLKTPAERDKFSMRSMTEFGGQGAGYRILRVELMRYIRALQSAGFHWTVTVQMRKWTEKVGDNLVTQKRELLFPTASELLDAAADVVAYIHADKVTVPVIEQRKLQSGKTIQQQTGTKTETRYFLDVTMEDPSVTMKRRILRFDESIQLPETGGWQVFADAYTKGVQKLEAQMKQSQPPKKE